MTGNRLRQSGLAFNVLFDVFYSGLLQHPAKKPPPWAKLSRIVPGYRSLILGKMAGSSPLVRAGSAGSAPWLPTLLLSGEWSGFGVRLNLLRHRCARHYENRDLEEGHPNYFHIASLDLQAAEPRICPCGRIPGGLRTDPTQPLKRDRRVTTFVTTRGFLAGGRLRKPLILLAHPVGVEPTTF